MRIVSLIPAASEIVCALGAGDELVGRSHECDHPPGVTELPAVTRSTIPAGQTSGAIHERVTEALGAGDDDPGRALSIYEVEAGLLDELAPDLIVTQAQCEVCAVSLDAVREAVSRMVGSRPRVVSLSPSKLADVWDDIRRVGEAIGRPEQAERRVGELRARLDRIAERVPPSEARPTIACIEWIDPPMVAGNWVPELVEIAGGRDVLAAPGGHSPWVSWDALRDADPDVIAVMPCGFGIEEARRDMPALTEMPGWAALRAVRTNRVHLTDGHQYFNRPGPRLVESAEILAELLHPGTFDFGHKERGGQCGHGT